MKKFLIPVFCFLCVLASHPQQALASVEVTTASELNEALGGGHTVDGDTVTLGADVRLSEAVELTGDFHLILNMNGKTIRRVVSENTPDDERYIFADKTGDAGNKSSFKVTGEGTLLAVDEELNTSELTVNSFLHTAGGTTLEIKGKLNDYCGINASGDNELIIRDGVYYTTTQIANAKTVICGGTFQEEITSGGDPYTTVSSYKLIIKGGVYKEINTSGSVWFKGGEVQKTKYDGRVINCGNKLVVSGGKINDAVFAKLKFEISGGEISSACFPVVKVGPGYLDEDAYIASARITGGKIVLTNSTGGNGVEISNGKLVLTGGEIINTYGKGSFGIYIDNSTLSTVIENDYCEQATGISLKQAKVYWKGVKGSSLHIKGFKTGFEKTEKTKSVILGSTKLSTPSAKKKRYTAKNVLPDKITGNIKMTYK
jgi:hypothetical protein